jgi:nicotinate phosphoribosyltransferase
MMPAFAGAGEAETAVFAVFVRKLPPGRNFLESAGLDHCLDLLEDLQVRGDELAWLSASGHFSAAFLDGMGGASPATPTRCRTERSSFPTNRSCA